MNAVEIGSPFRRRAAVDQRAVVSFEIGQQLAEVMFQAPDANHAAYGCTPRPAA
jgi:hypothetical protein